MALSRNPFEHLIPQNGPQDQQIQMPAQDNMDNQAQMPQNPFRQFIPTEQKEEMVDTFLGKLPKNPKEFQQGTPEFKENMESMLNSMVGAPGMKLVGKGAMSLGKGIGSLFNRVAPKELAYGVQKAHDTMLNKLTGMYDYVKEQALKRGMGKVKVPEGLFEQAEEQLPRTDKYRSLIDKARNGDYESLHQLQSDLGKKGTAAKGAKYHADRNVGEEMLDTRKKINKIIQNHFRDTGNNDLADMLGEASKGYRNYKKLYYTDRGIANLVHDESRLVPKNPLNLFSKESKPMSRILDAHPEVRKALKNEETAKSFLKGFKKGGKVATGVGITGGALYGYNTIANLLNHLSGE